MEPRPTLPVDYLVLEGNIGAGKTTLANRLAESFSCDLILEDFADNPFLELFYSDQDRYAMLVELFFMSERHKQMEPILRQPSLFAKPVLADYLYSKTWLFAQQTLQGSEVDLFKRLFDQLNAQVPLPQKLVYLHRPVEVLLAQIAKRARPFEASITHEYLTGIERTYWHYLRSEKRFPCVVLNLGGIDFEADGNMFHWVKSTVLEDHPPGLTITSPAGSSMMG